MGINEVCGKDNNERNNGRHSSYKTTNNVCTRLVCMKTIVFDTGPIISLTLNNLLWILEELRKWYKGEFYITPAVYDELINKPLSTRKYKLEALQVLPYITKGTLKVYNNLPIINIAKELDTIANKIFQVEGNYVQIVHRGEIEAVATAIFLKA